MLLFLSHLEASVSVRRIWLITPLRMSSGVEKILLMAGKGARKQDEFDGSINCKQLIDGLLIKKGVSDSAKQSVHSGESDIATVQ